MAVIPKERLETVKKILEVIGEENVTNKQFAFIFKKVVSTIRELRDGVESRFGAIESMVAGFKKELESIPPNLSDKIDSELTSLEKHMDDQFSVKKREMEKMCEDVENRLLLEVDALESRFPKLDGFYESFAEIVKKIPETETPESIREKLESLEDGEKLPIEAIQDLREELDELKRRPRGGGGGGGVSGRELVKSYDLSPLLDGVTKTFALPGNWTVLSVSGTSFPYTFRRLVDYTFTQHAITFTSEITADTSLAAGQTIEVLYVTA